MKRPAGEVWAGAAVIAGQRRTRTLELPWYEASGDLVPPGVTLMGEHPFVFSFSPTGAPAHTVLTALFFNKEGARPALQIRRDGVC